MIIADKFIFLELIKTGTTHIRRILKELGTVKFVGKHNCLPKNFSKDEKVIIGSIRNPWDWYVSLWAFGCDNKGMLYKRLTKRTLKGYNLRVTPLERIPHLLFLIVLEEAKKDVAEWRRVYGDSENPLLFRDWLHMILNPSQKYVLGDGYGFSTISSSAGLLTYYYLRLFSRDFGNDVYNNQSTTNINYLIEYDRKNNIMDEVIRMEFLEKDLINILQKINYLNNYRQLEMINNSTKTNSSTRIRALDFYYDRDSIELVMLREKMIIDKYGYIPPSW